MEASNADVGSIVQCEQPGKECAVALRAKDELVGTDAQVQEANEWVLQNVFKVPDPKPYLTDTLCSGLVGFATSMIQFQIHYRNLAKHIGGGIGNTKIEGTGGEQLSEDLQGKTLRDLAQRLWDSLDEHNNDFLQAFQTLQGVIQTGVEKAANLIDMQGTENDANEVDKRKMGRALRIDRLQEAVDSLTKPKKAMILHARVFMHNVDKQLFHAPQAKRLIEDLQKKEQEVKDKNREFERSMEQVADFQGKKASLEKRQATLEELKNGSMSVEEYLKRDLEDIKKRLVDARSREEKYTYRMWGPFISMWKNDVDLAKQQVSDLEQEKGEIEKQWRALAQGEDETKKRILEEAEQNTGDLTQAQGLADNAARDAAKRQKELKELEQERDSVKKNLKLVLGEEYSNVDQMMGAQAAFEILASTASQEAKTKNVVTKGYATELEDVIDLVDSVVNAKSLEQQQLKLDKLRTYFANPRIPLMRLAAATGNLLSIQLPPSAPRALLHHSPSGAQHGNPSVPALPQPSPPDGRLKLAMGRGQ